LKVTVFKNQTGGRFALGRNGNMHFLIMLLYEVFKNMQLPQFLTMPTNSYRLSI